MTFLKPDNQQPPRGQSGLQEMLTALDGMTANMPKATKEEGGVLPQKETISDDTQLPPELTASIQREEKLLRTALALFGIQYDELIRLDGRSSYAKAVEANPAVLEGVMQSESPVLAALQIAVGFQPYADFMTKYGNHPESIREAIRSEFEAEKKEKSQAVEKQKETTPGTPFSSPYGRGGKTPEISGKNLTLADIFKN